jgi:virginiamycin B lyase
MRLFAALIGLMAVTLADAQTAPVIDYWKVPWEKSRPRDPAVDRNGIVWFVGQTADYAASFDPKNEQFRKIDLDAGAGPHNLFVGEDNVLWYTGNRAAHIGRVDPQQGIVVEKIPMPDGVRDPHTAIGDGQGHVWFTAQGANHIGRITLAGRKVQTLALPTPNSLPYGIVIDANGRPWANLLGAPQLATVDPQSFKLELIDLPRKETRTRRIDIDSQGAIWYSDYAAGHIGRFDPKTRQIREWPLPAGAKSKPYALVIDDKDRIWISETGLQPNHLLAFDSKAEKFVTDVELKDIRGAVRHMVFHGPSRAIWFGSDTDYLVRVNVPR